MINKLISYNTLLIFLKINNFNTISKIQKELNFSHSGVIQNLNILISKKLIFKVKSGRENILKYSEKGVEIYELTLNFFNKLNEV